MRREWSPETGPEVREAFEVILSEVRGAFENSPLPDLETAQAIANAGLLVVDNAEAREALWSEVLSILLHGRVRAVLELSKAAHGLAGGDTPDR